MPPGWLLGEPVIRVGFEPTCLLIKSQTHGQALRPDRDLGPLAPSARRLVQQRGENARARGVEPRLTVLETAVLP